MSSMQMNMNGSTYGAQTPAGQVPPIQRGESWYQPAPMQGYIGAPYVNHGEQLLPIGYGQVQGSHHPFNTMNSAPQTEYSGQLFANPNGVHFQYPPAFCYGSTQRPNYSYSTMNSVPTISTLNPATQSTIINPIFMQPNTGLPPGSGAPNEYVRNNVHNCSAVPQQAPTTKKRRVKPCSKPKNAKQSVSPDENLQPPPPKKKGPNRRRKYLLPPRGNKKLQKTTPLSPDIQPSPTTKDSMPSDPSEIVDVSTGNKVQEELVPILASRKPSLPIKAEGDRFTFDGKEWFNFTYQNNSLDSPDQDTVKVKAEDELYLGDKLQDQTVEEFFGEKAYGELLEPAR